jgi:hypothetical protein
MTDIASGSLLVQAPDDSWWLIYSDRTMRSSDSFGAVIGDPQPWTPIVEAVFNAPDEIAARDAWLAAETARIAALDSARTALQDALDLEALYPAPTTEETALIDTQVAEALAEFRALSSMPADIVALAAAVVSWRSEL